MTLPDSQIINELIELAYRFTWELTCCKAKYKDGNWWRWFTRYNNERFQLLIENGRI